MKARSAAQKVLHVPIDGPPVDQTPWVRYGCELAGFRAVVLPPGELELAVQPRWHTVNIMAVPSKLDVLRVGGEDLTRISVVGESMCWTPRNADLRLVCWNPGWELNLEIDPERVAALAHEGLEGAPLASEFIFWKRDPVVVRTASLLIEQLRCPVIDRLLVEGLIIATAARALRLAAGNAEEPSIDEADPRLHRAIEYIHAHLDESMGMADLASEVGMSPWRFNRSFRAATGQSPHQYVVELRLRKARELLAVDGLPLSQVAFASGFASQSHMTDVFRKKLGITPGRYRRDLKI